MFSRHLTHFKFQHLNFPTPSWKPMAKDRSRVLLKDGHTASLFLHILARAVHLYKASIAKDILANMPNRALNLIQSSAFMGADLVRVESDIHRPSFRVGCVFFCLIKNHQNIVKMRSCWFKAPKMWRSTVNLNQCLGLYFSNWDTPPDDEGLYVWTQPLNPNMALQELATNYIWLKPIAQHFPTEVPGAVVLTDVFLHHGKNLDQSYI